MNTSTLLAGIVFGAVGTVAFIYGKKQSEMRIMIIGVLLLVYPYLIENAIAQWVIGALLTAALFIFR